MACDVFPDQGLNPCLPQRQGDPYPPHHQGSPRQSLAAVNHSSISGVLLPPLMPHVTFHWPHMVVGASLSLVCGESSRGLDGLHGTAQLRDEPAWAGPGGDRMIDGTEHHQSQDRGASGLQEESAAQSRRPACAFFTDARAPKAWLGLLATSHPRN